ncbi:porin [Buchnera aphidicola (Brachycaudus cardui)]|uniref:Porin n=1 Tax=Buchnera aphidicola (Brachycaudus cardui) TaxID=557993 RepID=A0A4D6Y882_9GAMM|nr:porin [Buchnera aphidicola]QCI20495.1 porin [Buchnera aphidicola (Brachycaudus cardui)]
MMNRKSLAIAIPMLLAASSGVNALEIFNKNGNKLELHGSINPNHELSHGFLSKKINSHNDNTNAILGLSGEINITDELLSYANIEYKSDLNVPEELLNKQKTNSVRLGYAGFKYGDWGSIDYGRNYGVLHDAQFLTNRIPYITQDSIFSYNDNYMVGRNNSLLTYRNNNLFGLFDGISFALQYEDQVKNIQENQNNGSGWGASLKYKTDAGLTAVGSFFSAERLKSEKDKDKNLPSSVDAYGLGFKYDANDIYIAAFYGVGSNLIPSDISNEKSEAPTKFIGKTENIEAVAEYNFHSGFHPSLSYLDSKGQELNSDPQNTSNNNAFELAKQINISTRYEFNKNISTYMNYKINLLKSNNEYVKRNNISTDNILGAGIVYQF